MTDEFDIDEAEDFEGEEKKSLKDIWEENPLLKVIAAVVILGTVYWAYITFLAPPESDIKDSSTGKISSTVEAPPGGDDLTPSMIEAIQEKNEQRVQEAFDSGTSALPTPIGSPSTTIDIPEAGGKLPTDPLSEWRRAAEARRMILEDDEDTDIEDPDIVPMVEPIRPQPTVTVDPELTGMLVEQMRVIVGTKVPTEGKTLMVTNEQSDYVKMQEEEAEEKARAAQEEANAQAALGPDGETGDVIIAGGDVIYSQLLTELNSDIPGPALAQVLSGPLAGGRALGRFNKEDEHLVLRFNFLVKDKVTYPIEAVAIDPNTTLTGLSTDVDHHYIKRIILPAAAAFIEGYTAAIAETASTTTTGAGGQTITDTPELSTAEELAKGYTKAAEVVSEVLEEAGDVPITVVVSKGTTMGLLFLRSLHEGDRE